MENESLSFKEDNLQESVNVLLNGLRNRLNDEVKKRQAIVKPIETIIGALKDPHRNAVTLYETTTALAKVSKTLIAPEEMEPLLTQLNIIAREKLSDLEFSFARDLRLAFEEKGIILEGEPKQLVAGLFIIQVNMSTRQVLMTFSNQPVTNKRVKLDINKVVSLYFRAKKEICDRNANIDELIGQIFETYQRLLKLTDKQMGDRVPIVECYRELVLTRQSSAFRKSPSKNVFVDYPKTHFIYDLLVARQENKLTTNEYILNLGTSTIEVGADSAKALFVLNSALNGQYIKDIYFTKEK